MNNEGVFKTSEMVIAQLPYRDEFEIAERILNAAKMYPSEFDKYGYDNGKWNESVEEYKTSLGLIKSQLINAGIIKCTQVGRDEYADKYVLTKIGRKMKTFETFENLKKYQNGKKYKKIEKERGEADFLNYQSQNAEWQLELNPLIKEANDSTIETNKNVRATNGHIKQSNKILIGIFSVTAIISAGGVYLSIKTYELEVLKQIESVQSKSAQQRIKQVDSLLERKNDTLHYLTKKIYSLEAVKSGSDSLRH